MELDDRIWYFMVGVVVGYIIHLLKDIKDELDEVDHVVKNRQNESGFSRNPLILDGVLLLVVAVTVFAAVASQKVSNDVQETQANQAQITKCNKNYLKQTIVALNQRTSFVQDQATSNVSLQTAEYKFFRTIYENPSNDKVEIASFKEYLNQQRHFVEVNRRVAKARNFNPYPTAQELADCLNK